MKNVIPAKRFEANSRREWLFIAIMTIVAAGLRFRSFGRLGLTHFDEGIYALAGLWALSPKGLTGFDPQLIPYAPPGFPILIGLAYDFLGVSDSVALFIPVICGVLTVPLVAWIGRRTFGPGAGAASATFAALALAHVAFSRKALTDVPFLLAWLATIGLGGRFLERPGAARAVAFGLTVGLAQNFKYNGWIALVVVALAAVFGQVANPEERHAVARLRTFGFGFVSALVAAMCYLPWYAFVENQEGGYAALVRHHRGYLGGTGTWLMFWKIQLGQAVFLSGGPAWGFLTWSVAWMLAGQAKKGMGKWFLELLIGGILLAFIPNLGWWVGLAWLPWLVTYNRPALRVLAASWLVLSVMTPFYHPYSRLWLPLHAAGWLMLAGSLVRLGPYVDSLLTRPQSEFWNSRSSRLKTLSAIFCVVLARVHWMNHPPSSLPVSFHFEPTDDLRRGVAELCLTTPDKDRIHLRVLGRRPIAFYLALHARFPFEIVEDRKALFRDPRDPDARALLDRVQVGPTNSGLSLQGDAPPLGWRKLMSSTNRLDPVTLLDHDPGAAFRSAGSETATLEIFAPETPPKESQGAGSLR